MNNTLKLKREKERERERGGGVKRDGLEGE